MIHHFPGKGRWATCVTFCKRRTTRVCQQLVQLQRGGLGRGTTAAGPHGWGASQCLSKRWLSPAAHRLARRCHNARESILQTLEHDTIRQGRWARGVGGKGQASGCSTALYTEQKHSQFMARTLSSVRARSYLTLL